MLPAWIIWFRVTRKELKKYPEPKHCLARADRARLDLLLQSFAVAIGSNCLDIVDILANSLCHPSIKKEKLGPDQTYPDWAVPGQSAGLLMEWSTIWEKVQQDFIPWHIHGSLFLHSTASFPPQPSQNSPCEPPVCFVWFTNLCLWNSTALSHTRGDRTYLRGSPKIPQPVSTACIQSLVAANLQYSGERPDR